MTMPDRIGPVPVVLFVYNRIDSARRALECIRRERPPRLLVFSDGPKDAADAARVSEVRDLVRRADGCETTVTCRETNIGIDRSVLLAAPEVFREFPAALFVEDDLVFVEGTCAYLAAALRAYAGDRRVTSVTGWTHPMALPPGVTDQPYFDGRSCSWLWGTWRDRWEGMDRTAADIARECARRGIDCYRHGADAMRIVRKSRPGEETWDARFGLHQMLLGGLCLRPPWSMVEHGGWGFDATHAGHTVEWSNWPLRPCPPLPSRWPEPAEHPDCARIWRSLRGGHPIRDVGSNVMYVINYVRRLRIRKARARMRHEPSAGIPG